VRNYYPHEGTMTLSFYSGLSNLENKSVDLSPETTKYLSDG